jgi:ferredoxin-fold anticodon binding domain-containing protein
MKLSFRHQAIQRKNSDVCVVTEHPIDDEIIDFAVLRSRVDIRMHDMLQTKNARKLFMYMMELGKYR